MYNHYNRLTTRRGSSTDSGIPRDSLGGEAREEEQTYVKPLVSPMSSFTSNSEPSLSGLEMNYNEVKRDMNTSQYVSGPNVTPRTADPNYVKIHPKPENPVNMDVAEVIKQVVAAGQEKNPDSAVVINIGHITINNTPDPTYYVNGSRPPPDPCLPHQYHYVDHPRDDQGRRKSTPTQEEEIYLGLPAHKTPVEHSGTAQPSVVVDDHIHPYRETLNFLNNSRSNSSRSNSTGSQKTKSSQQTGQRDAEPVEPHEQEENTTQMMLRPRYSPDGPSEMVDVQLVMPGSNQRWIGALRPLQTSESHSRSPSIATLDSGDTYTSHVLPRDRNRPTVPLTLENNTGSLQPTERWPNTETSNITGINGDRAVPYSGGDNTLMKEVSSPLGEGFRRQSEQRLTSVENPVYMADQPYRLTSNLTSSVRTQNVLGYNGEMEPSRPGVHQVVGSPMSQSAPDIRQVSPFQSQTARQPTFFPRRLKAGDHECVVQGYLSIHNEKAIEDAKKMLEDNGEDGNWLVTAAVRQPMQSYILHVRLQNKTNSFPVNNLKGNKMSIDTTNKKTFKCLCELIRYYTQKKTLPNQEVRLAKPFQLQRSNGEYDPGNEVSHL